MVFQNERRLISNRILAVYNVLQKYEGFVSPVVIPYLGNIGMVSCCVAILFEFKWFNLLLTRGFSTKLQKNYAICFADA